MFVLIEPGPHITEIFAKLLTAKSCCTAILHPRVLPTVLLHIYVRPKRAVLAAVIGPDG